VSEVIAGICTNPNCKSKPDYRAGDTMIGLIDMSDPSEARIGHLCDECQRKVEAMFPYKVNMRGISGMMKK